MGRHTRIVGWLRLLLIVLGGSYLGLEGWAYLTQDSFVYAPSSVVTGTPRDVGLPYDPITLNTPDGEHLTGWFIPAETTTPTTVLFLHGSGGNIAGCLAHAAIFHQLGVNTLLFDYRGYGQSTGTPSEAGLATDAETAWAYLTTTRGVPAAQIIIVGQSLGGGVATWLATQHRPVGLILDSTFTRNAFLHPWGPIFIPAQESYASIDRIGRIAAPVLVLHSRDDAVIAFSQAEALFAAAQPPKYLIALRGPHATGPVAEPTAYRAAVAAFLTSLTQAGTPETPAPASAP